jgi:hypothetical protein
MKSDHRGHEAGLDGIPAVTGALIPGRSASPSPSYDRSMRSGCERPIGPDASRGFLTVFALIILILAAFRDKR